MMHCNKLFMIKNYNSAQTQIHDYEPVYEELNEDVVYHDEVQLGLSKPIVRPWEELVHNQHRLGLVYKEAVTFFILDYSKPI